MSIDTDHPSNLGNSSSPSSVPPRAQSVVFSMHPADWANIDSRDGIEQNAVLGASKEEGSGFLPIGEPPSIRSPSTGEAPVPESWSPRGAHPSRHQHHEYLPVNPSSSDNAYGHLHETLPSRFQASLESGMPRREVPDGIPSHILASPLDLAQPARNHSTRSPGIGSAQVIEPSRTESDLLTHDEDERYSGDCQSDGAVTTSKHILEQGAPSPVQTKHVQRRPPSGAGPDAALPPSAHMSPPAIDSSMPAGPAKIPPTVADLTDPSENSQLEDAVAVSKTPCNERRRSSTSDSRPGSGACTTKSAPSGQPVTSTSPVVESTDSADLPAGSATARSPTDIVKPIGGILEPSRTNTPSRGIDDYPVFTPLLTIAFDNALQLDRPLASVPRAPQGTTVVCDDQGTSRFSDVQGSGKCDEATNWTASESMTGVVSVSPALPPSSINATGKPPSPLTPSAVFPVRPGDNEESIPQSLSTLTSSGSSDNPRIDHHAAEDETSHASVLNNINSSNPQRLSSPTLLPRPNTVITDPLHVPPLLSPFDTNHVPRETPQQSDGCPLDYAKSTASTPDSLSLDTALPRNESVSSTTNPPAYHTMSAGWNSPHSVSGNGGRDSLPPPRHGGLVLPRSSPMHEDFLRVHQPEPKQGLDAPSLPGAGAGTGATRQTALRQPGLSQSLPDAVPSNSYECRPDALRGTFTGVYTDDTSGPAPHTRSPPTHASPDQDRHAYLEPRDVSPTSEPTTAKKGTDPSHIPWTGINPSSFGVGIEHKSECGFTPARMPTTDSVSNGSLPTLSEVGAHAGNVLPRQPRASFSRRSPSVVSYRH